MRQRYVYKNVVCVHHNFYSCVLIISFPLIWENIGIFSCVRSDHVMWRRNAYCLFLCSRNKAVMMRDSKGEHGCIPRREYSIFPSSSFMKKLIQHFKKYISPHGRVYSSRISLFIIHVPVLSFIILSSRFPSDADAAATLFKNNIGECI